MRSARRSQFLTIRAPAAGDVRLSMTGRHSVDQAIVPAGTFEMGRLVG